MFRNSRLTAAAAVALGVALGYAASAGRLGLARTALAQDRAAPDRLDRTVLPIPEPKLAPITTLDARNAKVTIRYEFKYGGGGLGKGGVGTIFVNGEKVVEGKIDKTQPYVFSADEGADVGRDGETPVTSDYKEGDNKFTGTIGKVTVELK